MAKATRKLSLGRIIYEIKRLTGKSPNTENKTELEGEEDISLARGDINTP